MSLSTLSIPRTGLALVAAGLLILVVLSMQLVSLARSSPEEQAREAIRQVLDTQVADWNRGDLDGFMAGYWNSPELSFFPERDARGWVATREYYRKTYAAGPGQMGTLSFNNLEIDPLAPGNALVRGQYQLIRDSGMQTGFFTLIVRKLPEGWRIIHDHTSGPPAKVS
jgi:beta-aspartyl-peptidase (threonine type)